MCTKFDTPDTLFVPQNLNYLRDLTAPLSAIVCHTIDTYPATAVCVGSEVSVVTNTQNVIYRS